jgi:methylenetetrahydrofolate/methylenetetrahydromethanopterin dehydrogenase (NADP+)
MKKILIQLDTDSDPSTFDRVVAVDSGVDHLFSYGDVTPENVTGLIHGAIFTRGPADLNNTAIFVGGSNVAAGEALLKQVEKTFFGPMRVSVLMDSNGCNTTAAAAVLAAGKHLDLTEISALILGGTGPVGHRAAQILTGLGATVRIGSRSIERAEQTCAAVRATNPDAKVSACETSTPESVATACDDIDLLLATGAAGIELVNEETWQGIDTLKVAIDLNAVPPAGIAGIEVFDKAVERANIYCYGAVGVGGTKMKIHKAAIARLYERNDFVLDTASIFDIGQNL